MLLQATEGCNNAECISARAVFMFHNLIRKNWPRYLDRQQLVQLIQSGWCVPILLLDRKLKQCFMQCTTHELIQWRTCFPNGCGDGCVKKKKKGKLEQEEKQENEWRKKNEGMNDAT